MTPSPIRHLLIALSVILAACSTTPREEATGEHVDDTVVSSKVKAAVLNDPGLKAEINVETVEGRVQMSGFLPSRADINRAVEVARGVGGVRSVSNVMRVK